MPLLVPDQMPSKAHYTFDKTTDLQVPTAKFLGFMLKMMILASPKMHCQHRPDKLAD
jgi:hypothetical protein